MADHTHESTPVATQKRPLEETSSPSGPTDQPDAKRPALAKIMKEDGTNTIDSAGEGITKDETSADAKDVLNDDVAGFNTQPEVTVQIPAPVHTNEHGEVAKHEVKNEDDATPANGLTEHGQGVVAGAAGKGPSPGPANPQDETNHLYLRAIISSQEAATVIGKQGENVQQIRQLSGAKCTVSEYSRGQVERILTISGPVDSVAKAFGLVVRTINQESLHDASTPQSKAFPLRLLIPHILIGSIIGKQGIRIREIQDASGARLNASEQCIPGSSERSLIILGVADAVHIATYYVGGTLVEQLIERFGGPAASNYAARNGKAQGVVPGGMQVVAYQPMHTPGQVAQPDGYRKYASPPQRAPTGPYGAQYPHGQMQPPQQQMQGPMHYPNAGSPHGTYMGAGPQQPAAFGHAAPHVSHGGPPQQPMQGVPQGQTVTQQIYIPNDMVGAIIGKGGSKINEIRTLSGSAIKINEPQENTNERLVTITGTQQSNQMALYMLYSRLGESSKNSNAVMPR